MRAAAMEATTGDGDGDRDAGTRGRGDWLERNEYGRKRREMTFEPQGGGVSLDIAEEGSKTDKIEKSSWFSLTISLTIQPFSPCLS